MQGRQLKKTPTMVLKLGWRQLKEVAFRIDVAIDEYLLHVVQHPRRGFIGFLQKITHLLKSLKPRHKIATEIQDIKASVQKINERSKRYGFQSTYHQGSSSAARNITWHDPRMASLFLDDTDVVGIETSRDELLGTLVGGSSHRTVISVVGMGGQGKTTLVKKVYDHPTVKGHFDCHSWIPVSQSYNVEDLLRSMIKQFCKARKEFPPEGIDSTDKMLVINKAREYLREKRYVVVFDDVWEIDFWGEIEHALPDNEKGGRVMITTRKWEVANFCKKSSLVHVHELQPLPPNDAWELFCKRAFQFDYGGHCPPELEKLSHYIVEKCEGLPLAIVAIGGLLSTKDKTILEWQNLYDSLGFELGRNPHLAGVNKILSLSYEDLPYNLKILFFIPWSTLMEELERCRLHDLFREIVLQKMEDLSFCHVLSREESSFEGRTRRLSIDGVSYNALEGFEDKHIHSLLLFNLDELPKSFMITFFANFKLLKVMDFEDAPLDHIPEDVGSLFHLRHTLAEQLHFQKGGFPKLKILRLRHLNGLYSLMIDEGASPLLESLVIGPSPQLKEVPSGIQHLRNLKYLAFSNMPKEFEEMFGS
uniref:NB-ARC domain-containing protein n=1 Tax=Fagus sylvatica TaxID=28930 RepID=A0A2N9G186_FAGSY